MPRQNIAERVHHQKVAASHTTQKHAETLLIANNEETLNAQKEGLTESQRNQFQNYKEKLHFLQDSEVLAICLKHDFNQIILESIVEGMIKRNQEADEGDWFSTEQAAPKKTNTGHSQNYKGKYQGKAPFNEKRNYEDNDFKNKKKFNENSL